MKLGKVLGFLSDSGQGPRSLTQLKGRKQRSARSPRAREWKEKVWEALRLVLRGKDPLPLLLVKWSPGKLGCSDSQ